MHLFSFDFNEIELSYTMICSKEMQSLIIFLFMFNVGGPAKRHCCLSFSFCSFQLLAFLNFFYLGNANRPSLHQLPSSSQSPSTESSPSCPTTTMNSSVPSNTLTCMSQSEGVLRAINIFFLQHHSPPDEFGFRDFTKYMYTPSLKLSF